MAASASLGSSTEPLDQRYDLAMLDLDGVVYIGSDAVPGAPKHVAAARAAGMRVAFITNNASRPPAAVAEHLRELGVEAGRRRRRDLGPGRRAGPLRAPRRGRPGRGCWAARGWPTRSAEAGLVQVGVEEDAEAVVTGYGPEVLWRQDHAGRGARPGRTVVGRLQHRPARSRRPSGWRRATGCWSRRCGGSRASNQWSPASRPGRSSTRLCAACGGDRPLMVGDRLDTDIEGAHAAGVDSLLVMTGRDRAVRAGGGRARAVRPTYISTDLGGLDAPQPLPEVSDDAVSLGGWRAPVSRRCARDVRLRGDRRLVAGGGRGGVATPRRRRRASRDQRGGSAPE